MWWHSRQEKISTLPPGHTDEELTEWFNNFFITKIVNIRESLKAIHPETIIAEDNNSLPSFTQFKELSVEDIIKLIKQSPSKSYETGTQYQELYSKRLYHQSHHCLFQLEMG